jgi:hypothetical protein
MFVAPKNTVYDKKTGMTHVIPEYANLVQPPNETVSPSNCFEIDPLTGIQRPTDCGGLGNNPSSVGGAAVDITTSTTLPPVDTTTPSTTTTLAPINIPINLGTAPTAIGSLVAGGGGGRGGGGASEGTAAKPKTFLQKYWWLLLLAAAGGGYLYYKKRKK